MSDGLRTNHNHFALRQIRSEDGLRVFSTIKTAGGFRFIEEAHIHEPAGPGYDDYWYWEIVQESGIYASEVEAFDDGVKALGWPARST